MSAFKVFNLLAVTTLALFVSSFGATPVNALAHGGHHLNRQIHADVAKRGKRANTKRCKNRPTSTLVSTTVAPTTSAAPPAPPAETPQPSSSSTQAPAGTPAPSTGGTPASGRKLMIGWNNPDPSKLALFSGTAAGSYYTWSAWEQPNNFGLEFFPMFWGPAKVGEIQKNILPGKYQDILFFNEPDQGRQANTDPGTAVANWWSHMEPLGNAGARLWSPAVTSSPDGEKWMDQFMSACSTCNIYGIPVHWYGTNPDELISFVKRWQGKYGKPIALTEFACQDFSGQGHVADMGEIWAFYKKVMPFLMGPEGPAIVAPFGFLEDMGNVNPNNQMLRGGQLTDLGWYIVGGNY